MLIVIAHIFYFKVEQQSILCKLVHMVKMLIKIVHITKKEESKSICWTIHRPYKQLSIFYLSKKLYCIVFQSKDAGEIKVVVIGR